ncbi:MAG: pyruvate, phosphate dikinase/phosphoenolpyruvate synthase regulator [Pirellulales bacterium]|nr:pyruvate, phosphate dikinase/phosphoenolpyruvate synthase regulator [Pirellulales bacterium]
MAKKKPAARKPPASHAKRYALHVITAATGDLLQRFAAVAATQFSGIEFEVVAHRLKKTLEEVAEALAEIDPNHAIVIHGLADPNAKRLVRNTCIVQRIPHFDATGPLMNFIADCVGALPDNDVGRLHQVDAAYQRRIAAMEFTIQHDDGLGLDSLADAEIVIVGVSRVSKSPTSLYLGARGFCTANVSIAPEVGFPKQLARARKGRVAALTMQPKRLQEIRAQRAEAFGVPGAAYDRLDAVIREVAEAEAEYRRRKYPIIDVTSLTIEQTAARILNELGVDG